MKALKQDTIDTFEEIALLGAAEIKKYFTYQGTNKDFFNKAKVGSHAIGAYARLRASETNRMAVEHAMGKTPARAKK